MNDSKNSLETTRLTLREIELVDAAFILELLNTPHWIKFIGDRKIKTLVDATAYVQKIKDNISCKYWTVEEKECQKPIGLITFMKRDYLDYYDIGFAFLPAYFKQGYAYEAANVILDDAKKEGHKKIVATVLRENINSIQLLEKLGLTFSKEIEVNNETLQLYSSKLMN